MRTWIQTGIYTVYRTPDGYFDDWEALGDILRSLEDHKEHEVLWVIELEGPNNSEYDDEYYGVAESRFMVILNAPYYVVVVLTGDYNADTDNEPDEFPYPECIRDAVPVKCHYSGKNYGDNSTIIELSDGRYLICTNSWESYDYDNIKFVDICEELGISPFDVIGFVDSSVVLVNSSENSVSAMSCTRYGWKVELSPECQIIQTNFGCFVYKISPVDGKLYRIGFGFSCRIGWLRLKPLLLPEEMNNEIPIHIAYDRNTIVYRDAIYSNKGKEWVMQRLPSEIIESDGYLVLCTDGKLYHLNGMEYEYHCGELSVMIPQNKSRKPAI